MFLYRITISQLGREFLIFTKHLVMTSLLTADSLVLVIASSSCPRGLWRSWLAYTVVEL